MRLRRSNYLELRSEVDKSNRVISCLARDSRIGLRLKYLVYALMRSPRITKSARSLYNFHCGSVVCGGGYLSTSYPSNSTWTRPYYLGVKILTSTKKSTSRRRIQGSNALPSKKMSRHSASRFSGWWAEVRVLSSMLLKYIVVYRDGPSSRRPHTPGCISPNITTRRGKNGVKSRGRTYRLLAG